MRKPALLSLWVLITGVFFIVKTLPIVGLLPNITIQVQLGEHYSYQIPQYFQTYQHGRVTNFTHEKEKFKTKVCSISTLNQSYYFPKQVHFHLGYAQTNLQYYGDKIIYKFEDLIKLKQVMDSVFFNNKLVVLFQTKFFAVYSIDQNGHLKILQPKQSVISQHAGISYGNFIQNNQYILFFSETQIFYFNQNTDNFQPVTGYDPIGYQFQYATMYNNQIYVAAGEKGFLIYQFNFSTKTIYKKMQFNLTQGQGNQKFKLNPSDIQYDPKNNLIYIIDSQEGIKWFKPPIDDTLTQVPVQTSNVYVENCQNLRLTDQFLFATCPNIIKISLTNKSDIKIGPSVDFYPSQMILNNSRVILLGEDKYAIWDTEGGSIQSGYSNHLTSMAYIVKQWIIIVNQFDISVGSIYPSMEEMYCELDKTDKIVGVNEFNLSLEGICSQLIAQNYSHLLNKVEAGNCIIQQPVKLIVHDSSIVNYFIQFVLIGILLWSGTVGAIYYCVKDYKVRKGYQNLPEQKTAMDQGKSEQVMSSKSQQIENK